MIRKALTKGSFIYRQSEVDLFSSEYLVQTDASFPSPQLETYALNIAQAESRFYPARVHFQSANIKLATPGATDEELRGQFSQVGLHKMCGQWVIEKDDALAFPPVVAVFARMARGGRSGRLNIPHAVSAAEWNLYHQKRVVPLRFQDQDRLNQLSPVPALSFGQELIEAVRAASGTYVLSGEAGRGDQRLRPVETFVFHGFQVSSSRPKRKKAALRRFSPANVEGEAESPARKKGSKAKEPIAGVVYLLRAGPHFKIGKSINPAKRLAQIKLQLPYASEVVHTIRAADALQAESHWHRRFAASRQNGEWFLLTGTEVEEFRSVSEM